MSERWTRPIRAVSEEYPVELSQPGERPLLHILVGDDVELAEDAERLDAGLACSECLAVFPARPELANLHRFRELHWGPDWLRESALKRVALGQCPLCGTEVSPAMRALQDWGTNDTTRDPGEGNQ